MHSNNEALKLGILRTSHEHAQECYTSLRSNKSYSKSNFNVKHNDHFGRKSIHKNGDVSHLCNKIIKKACFLKKTTIVNSGKSLSNPVRPHNVSNIFSNNLIHNRKHVKLKSELLVSNIKKNIYNGLSQCPDSGANDLCGYISINKQNPLSDESVSSEDGVFSSNFEYILESTKRIEFIQNYDFQCTQVNLNLELHDILLKNQDLELLVTRDPNYLTLSTSTKNSNLEHQNVSDINLFVCKWDKCKSNFLLPDKLVKHVKNEHILKASYQSAFSCLWKNCKFFNHPSCSHKWLLTHVLRHCDVKPFKCVIHGCGGSFATQSGLARHVPTHFNDGKVRRTCVTNNCQINSVKDKCQSKIHGNSKRKSDDIAHETLSSLKDEEFSLNNTVFLNQKSTIKSSDFNSHILKKIKRKLQQPLCGSSITSGYVNKCLRLDHRIIGKRVSTTTGLSEVLVSPMHNILNGQSFWVDADAICKSTHVDIPIYQMSEYYKGLLYDAEKPINYRSKH